MLIDLTQKDLVRLVGAVSPTYQHMNHPTVKGTLTPYDRWEWQPGYLQSLTEYQLCELYCLMVPHEKE